MNKIEKLLDKMTIEEKIVQLTGSKYHDIYDIKRKTIKDKADRVVKNGVGYIGRIGGSNDNTPREVVRAVNEIQKYTIENSRLNIPVLFLTEATSGVLGRDFTLFPGNLNVGAMFNEKLTYKMGEAIKKEMVAVGERLALAPVVDVVRDHRYGRYEESYSEDVYLATQNGIKYIEGLQGRKIDCGVATTLKHFAGQGISDGGKNCAPIHVGQREFLDQYVAPFEACIKETNPACIMVAYHEIDGIPCHSSRKLLKDILRKKLGFEGLIMSDGGGIELVKSFQEYCETFQEAAILCFEAGIEMELGSVFSKYLKEEIEKGNITEEQLDNAVKSVLDLKNKLGLFENPYVDEDQVEKIVQCARHIDISYQIARESIIMLENKNNLLPLNTNNYKKIAVVGPLANRKDFAYGDYSYPTHIKGAFYNAEKYSEEEVIAYSLFYNAKGTRFEELYHDTKTLYEVIVEEFHESDVIYEPGVKDTYNYDNDQDFCLFDKMKRKCQDSDLIIAVCGDTSGMGYKNDTGESTDRVEITLPDEQQQMLKKLSKINKPLILILANGRPLELSLESKICNSILETFRTGQKGAEAIVDVLVGRCNPAGRLPVTIPKHQGQLPVFYSQRPTGHKQFWKNEYLEMDINPLYEFGYGLSYTEFEYDFITKEIDNDALIIKFKVTNVGEYDGHEVIQVYVNKHFCSVCQPIQELKAYKKIWLEKRETKTLECQLNFDSLGYHNIDMDYVLEDCLLKVMIGSSCKNIKITFTERLKLSKQKRYIKEKKFSNQITVLR